MTAGDPALPRVILPGASAWSGGNRPAPARSCRDDAMTHAPGTRTLTEKNQFSSGSVRESSLGGRHVGNEPARDSWVATPGLHG
jgi:hypothetical protein